MHFFNLQLELAKAPLPLYSLLTGKETSQPHWPSAILSHLDLLNYHLTSSQNQLSHSYGMTDGFAFLCIGDQLCNFIQSS